MEFSDQIWIYGFKIFNRSQLARMWEFSTVTSSIKTKNRYTLYWNVCIGLYSSLQYCFYILLKSMLAYGKSILFLSEMWLVISHRYLNSILTSHVGMNPMKQTMSLPLMIVHNSSFSTTINFQKNLNYFHFLKPFFFS